MVELGAFVSLTFVGSPTCSCWPQSACSLMYDPIASAPVKDLVSWVLIPFLLFLFQLDFRTCIFH